MTTDKSIQTKNAFFFSHDSNARNDEKIIELRMRYGAEGYGIYFMLVEMLMESTDYVLSTNYLRLAFSLHVKEEMLQSVVEDFGLFVVDEDGGFFYSPSLHKRLKPLEDLREKRRQAGIKSGEARRAKASKTMKEEQVMNTCSTDDAKKRTEESRVEKRKEEERRVEQSRAEVAVAPSKADRFVPPTLTAVESYCRKRKNEVDATKFHDFYQSKGWMVGRNKMKDWEASIRTWERDGKLGRRQVRAPNIANHDNEKDYEKF